MRRKKSKNTCLKHGESTEKLFSADELKRRGIVKTADGYRTYDVLSRYLEKGWLSLALPKGSRISDMDLFSAGKRLQNDFIRSSFPDAKAFDPAKIMVDTSCGTHLSDAALDARQRFSQALKAIPKDYHGVIWQVCIFDREIVQSSFMPKSLRDRLAFAAKRDLSRALIHLVEFYAGKKS